MILAALTSRRDITLDELVVLLERDHGEHFAAARCTVSSPGAGSRSKKTAHASEQARPDVAARRQAWFDGQPEFDPERLIFIDESGASTKMARLRGRAPRGERCRAALPHGHRPLAGGTLRNIRL